MATLKANVSKTLRRMFKTKQSTEYNPITIPIVQQQDKPIEKDPQVRPYKDIPGPAPLPIIGNTFRFLPMIGNYDPKHAKNLLRQFHSEFGDVVRLEDIPGQPPRIFLFNADMCATIYRTDGEFPIRPGMESILYYAKMINREPGLATLQGKKWRKLRSFVGKALLDPREVYMYAEKVDTICKDLVNKMRRMRNAETYELPDKFNNELSKWALECVTTVAMGRRLGCLDDNLAADSDAQKLIDSACDVFETMYVLENSFIWKFVPTPTWKRFCDKINTILMIANNHIDDALKQLQSKSSPDAEDYSLLERLLISESGFIADKNVQSLATTMILDLMTSGVDTVSNATGKALYTLAINPRIQDRLSAEVQDALQHTDGQFTHASLNKMPYLKACVQESLRLFPTATGTTRTTTRDLVLGGYQIPKGSIVMLAHCIMCEDERYFKNPHDFVPERWLRDGDKSAGTVENRYAHLPFGTGARNCIAERLARLEIAVLIGSVVSNFKLEWHQEPLKIKSRIIDVVDSPLKMTILDRN